MSIKYNKSSFCILPILNINRDLLYWNNSLLNCYIGIKEYEDYKDHIILLFKFKSTAPFLSVKELLINHSLYRTSISFTSKSTEYHLFIMNLPEDKKEVLDLFKKGKYSKFNKEYKDLIEIIHKVTPKKQLYHILRKTNDLRKQLEQKLGAKIPVELDLWSIPYKKDEILILKNLD